MEHVPFLVSMLPTLMMLGRLRWSRSGCYMLAPGSAAGARRERNRPLYLFLLNKWYFDELYDLIFVRPAFWLGRLFWKGGDGASSTASGRTASPRPWSAPPTGS